MLTIILYCLSFLLVEYLSKHFGDEKTQKRVQIVLCFLLLFTFFGFRGLSVLNDTAHYYRYARDMFSSSSFDSTPWYTVDHSLYFEAGFQILIRVIGLFISKEPYSLIIITSLITTIALLWFLSKTTRHIAFVIFVMLASTFLFGYYTITRQALAISISYIMYYCYKNRYYKSAIICAIVAYFFHRSSLVLILPIVLYHIPFTKRNMTIVALTTIIVALTIYQIMAYFGYGDHAYIETSMQRETAPLAKMLDILFISGYLIFYYIYKAKYRAEIVEDKLFVSFGLSALIVSIWSLPLIALSRLSTYFIPYAIILFVNTLYDAEAGKRMKPIKTIAIAILLARLIVILAFKNEWIHLIPYNFFDFNATYQQTIFGY